jgi:hypothetical protein
MFLKRTFLLLFWLIAAIFICGCKKTYTAFFFGPANNPNMDTIVNYNQTISFLTTAPATWAI